MSETIGKSCSMLVWVRNFSPVEIADARCVVESGVSAEACPKAFYDAQCCANRFHVTIVSKVLGISACFDGCEKNTVTVAASVRVWPIRRATIFCKFAKVQNAKRDGAPANRNTTNNSNSSSNNNNSNCGNNSNNSNNNNNNNHKKKKNNNSKR